MVSESSLIDPYALLGLTPKEATLDQARRAYYELALVTHPDKGGSASDMRVVAAAYKQVAAQLGDAAAARQLAAVEWELRQDESNLTAPDERLPVPSWREVVGEAGAAAVAAAGHAGVNAQLNAAFDALLNLRDREDVDMMVDSPLLLEKTLLARQEGYGMYMEASQYAGTAGPPQYSPEVPVTPSSIVSALPVRKSDTPTVSGGQIIVAPADQHRCLTQRATSGRARPLLTSTDYVDAHGGVHTGLLEAPTPEMTDKLDAVRRRGEALMEARRAGTASLAVQHGSIVLC